MSKHSSAKYYQDNKERLQKKLVKDIKVFLKKEKKKSDNMVEYRKKYKMWKKVLIIIIRNYFHLEMLVFSWRWAR